jgi:alpha-tubulin suppressor-like RCC1 family protein
MKKRLIRCAMAAAFIGVVLLVVVSQSHPPGIWVGKPLPPGKVRPQVVNAWDFALLLAPDGSLWAWGGTYSSLNFLFAQPAVSEVPRRIGSESDWMQVGAGLQHTVALKADESLWAWGTNNVGQVGQPELHHQYGIPTRIGTETNWSQICCGISHTLALKNNGSLWAWGWNKFGQLGDGSTNDRFVPTKIGSDRDWRTITASAAVSYAIKSNGTLWAWGQGGSNSIVPVRIGADTNWLAFSASDFALLAVKTDGTLWLNIRDVPIAASGVLAGPTEHLTQVGQDHDWIEAYAGGFYSLSRKKDGSWWVCGQNIARPLSFGGQVTNTTALQRLPYTFEPWAFAPGAATTLFFCKDGKLWTWGKRLGWKKPSAGRQKIDSFLFPLVNRFPSLRFLIKSNVDREPHLLWELPPEVRRSLRAEPKSSTNNLTN